MSICTPPKETAPARCPQGRPVLVQAGSSDTGRRFAARNADAVFTAHMAKDTAQEFYADLKRLAAVEGRAPEHVLILPPPDVVIPPRASAVLSADTTDRQSQRDRHIRMIAVKGRMGWQRRNRLRQTQPGGNGNRPLQASNRIDAARSQPGYSAR
jgi:alkanesulfonate monooxygenase SsuD/methylene tetrahydromethanopterin reductase-like flavin-dependent oxidoreductase (luciferase family)